MTFSKNRRRLLGGIAGLGGVALASPYLIRPAYAQQGGVVDIISYQGFIPEAFKAQFEAETGIELRIRLTDDSAKALAEGHVKIVPEVYVAGGGGGLDGLAGVLMRRFTTGEEVVEAAHPPQDPAPGDPAA